MIFSGQKKSRANSTASWAVGTCSAATELASNNVTVGDCMCPYEIALSRSVGPSCGLPVLVRHLVHRLKALKEARLDQLACNLTNILQPETTVLDSRNTPTRQTVNKHAGTAPSL